MRASSCAGVPRDCTARAAMPGARLAGRAPAGEGGGSRGGAAGGWEQGAAPIATWAVSRAGAAKPSPICHGSVSPGNVRAKRVAGLDASGRARGAYTPVEGLDRPSWRAGASLGEVAVQGAGHAVGLCQPRPPRRHESRPAGWYAGERHRVMPPMGRRLAPHAHRASTQYTALVNQEGTHGPGDPLARSPVRGVGACAARAPGDFAERAAWRRERSTTRLMAARLPG